MLKKLFNLFSSKKPVSVVEENENDDKVLVSITYYIEENSSKIIIDASMRDYDEASTQGMCDILDVLCQDATYAETLNMIKNALMEDGREDLLIQIFTQVSQSARDKVIKVQKESVKDEPCIKPSDML